MSSGLNLVQTDQVVALSIPIKLQHPLQILHQKVRHFPAKGLQKRTGLLRK